MDVILFLGPLLLPFLFFALIAALAVALVLGLGLAGVFGGSFVVLKGLVRRIRRR